MLLFHLGLTNGWIATDSFPTVGKSSRYRMLTTATIRLSMAVVVTEIESTPNPSSFIVKLSEPLVGMEDYEGSLRGKTFTKKVSTSRPPLQVASILSIEGIESVYAMATALTINKDVSAKWEYILPSVLTALGGESESNQEQLFQGLLVSSKHQQQQSSSQEDDTNNNGGQVRIRMQVSNKIPIQIECTGFLGTTKRMKLSPPKFAASIKELMEKGGGGADFFAGRKWVDRGVRYVEMTTLHDNEIASGSGNLMSEQDQEQRELDAILFDEIEEVDAAYSPERLATIVAESQRERKQQQQQQQQQERAGIMSIPSSSASSGMTDDVLLDLESVSCLCDLAEQGDAEAISALARFVSCHQGSNAARRNALAFLGGTGDTSTERDDSVFNAIVSALQKEKNPIMRRTAGDALSDLGDGRAVQPAVTALGDDRSKLVQWRAARILGEFGDSMDVVAVLKQASFSHKYAFEVAFEIKDALRKVQARAQTTSGVDSVNGATTRVNTGPVWKQIQDSIDSKS
jgi:hypothetical protein